jgi:hypothetical protein
LPSATLFGKVMVAPSPHGSENIPRIYKPNSKDSLLVSY